MATFAIVLTQSPYQHEHEETAYGIADAALEQGHSVNIFCYIDGVYGPMKNQSFPDVFEHPRERFAALLARGATVMCCGLCVTARGIDGKSQYVDGVSIGMLPDLANMVSDADCVVSL